MPFIDDSQIERELAWFETAAKTLSVRDVSRASANIRRGTEAMGTALAAAIRGYQDVGSRLEKYKAAQTSSALPDASRRSIAVRGQQFGAYAERLRLEMALTSDHELIAEGGLITQRLIEGQQLLTRIAESLGTGS